MSRQIVLSLAVAVAVLATAGGVVLAVTKTCLETDCIGTREDDTLTVGDDNPHTIAGLEGNDIITGGPSDDTIYGDEGDDTINDDTEPGPGLDNDLDVIYGDEGNDTIDCGPGKRDTVFFDEGTDTVTRCEKKNPSQ